MVQYFSSLKNLMQTAQLKPNQISFWWGYTLEAEAPIWTDHFDLNLIFFLKNSNAYFRAYAKNVDIL
jgi:hypothetical protein